MNINIPVRVLAFPESTKLAYYNSRGDDRLDDAPEGMTSAELLNSVGVAVWKIEGLIERFRKSSNPLWLWESYRVHRWTCAFCARPKKLTREAFTASTAFANHPFRARVIDYLYATADLPSTIAVYLDSVAERLLGIPLSPERLLEGEGRIVEDGPHEGEELLGGKPEMEAYALGLAAKNQKKAKGGKRKKGGGGSLYLQYLKDVRDEMIYDDIEYYMDSAPDMPDKLNKICRASSWRSAQARTARSFGGPPSAIATLP